MAAFASEPARLDEEGRADLICYLVVGQLIALSRTREWLRTDHLVESIRIWLASNGAEASWSERLQLGTLSEKLAHDFSWPSAFADSDFLARLFTDGWRLDYRSLDVRWLHDICDGYLRGDGELPTPGGPVHNPQ